MGHGGGYEQLEGGRGVIRHSRKKADISSSPRASSFYTSSIEEVALWHIHHRRCERDRAFRIEDGYPESTRWRILIKALNFESICADQAREKQWHDEMALRHVVNLMVVRETDGYAAQWLVAAVVELKLEKEPWPKALHMGV